MEMQKTRARRKQRRKQEIYIGAVGRTIIKYAILTLIGIVLFRAGAAAGLRERGYEAVGGEAFALLPVLYYLISTTVKDWIDDIRAEARKGGRR